ncbi:RagB/SusD family nutrient uptake outer membrane protein [Pedobacter polaris]|uniref:RagB/SusD family nutrient uptake outer membrane protein n=1 Tax=Pedobacter polaris TaxID=2571273 RepID=A0A4V5NZY3_9SPHI|nr:RagB/SusD family nutrient uptake outer membrane protein [Pedobacter polaris]TKC10452.1 RagB/SusD family nutrient uptake outer membrane protein [Pedobacter polaris]
MKMNLNKKVATLLVLGMVAGGSWSCKKMLDVPIENNLDYSNAYKNVSDADAAVLGIYGQFQELQKIYILQNELRADLLDVTANSTIDLQDLSNHNTAKTNPYIDPRPYYKLIVNCNDVLKNFDKMKAEFKMSVDDYNKHYSDIGALRSWIYLQLGIQYGSVPYITDALETVDDLKGLANYPKISFDALLDKLIAFTESLPYKEVYAYTAGNPILATVDGNSTARFFITKPFLLGDLYLWKGNYFKAAENYSKCMKAEDNNANDNFRFNFYKINTFVDAVYANLGVQFSRWQDPSSLVNSPDVGWRAIFGLPTTLTSWNTEWFWALPYNPAFKPGNPMIDLVSPTRSYQIRPSQAIKDYWNSQMHASGIPADARGRLSYSTTLGGDMITKFTDNGGKWGIYRAALLHLRFAEAANRDGQSKLGWAFLNIGLTNTYYVGTYTAGAIAPVNEAEQNTMITPYPATSPYYFDARKTADLSGTWYRNSGIRGRAGLVAHPVALQTDMIGLEDKLIDEAALELAFEGNRWPDLVRIARRQNNPAFLADRVYQKLLKAGNPNAASVRAKLMNPANWYLPFDWK